jgi:DNA-binding response OmpR family regulator
MESRGNPDGSYRALVVDDDERFLALARLSLAKIGIDAETATSAADGLEMLAQAPADLVILDVLMPDLLGWEVLRQIRASSDVPVMLLSGRDSDVDKARGLDLGADDYLTKPFSFLEFEARVRALLRRARRTEQDLRNP